MSVSPTTISSTIERMPSGDDRGADILTVGIANADIPVVGSLTGQIALDTVPTQETHHPPFSTLP
jgi:hypothetical protein